MGTLSGVTERIAQRKQDAERTLNECARREAAGKAKAGDVVAVEDALNIAGREPAYFHELIAFWRKAQGLRKEAKTVDKLGGELSAARTKARQHGEQTKKMMEARRVKGQELDREAAAIAGRLDKAQRAEDELDRLEAEHWQRFGHDAPINLDAFTLLCDGIVINVSDSKAPTRSVNAETFARESRRRHELLQAAQNKARQEHAKAHEAWWRSSAITRMGSRPFVPESKRASEPKLVLPTWSDIARRNGAGKNEAPKAKSDKQRGQDDKA